MAGMKTLLFVLVLVLTAATVAGMARERAHRDDYLYNKMATIRGTVTVVNHPTLGEFPAARNFLLFQRVDSPKAVVGVTTDENGRYSLCVSQGEYRVIVRYGSREGELEDGLAPDQKRIVKAESPIEPTEFNIQVVPQGGR
jgi:hypothetical protein